MMFRQLWTSVPFKVLSVGDRSGEGLAFGEWALEVAFLVQALEDVRVFTSAHSSGAESVAPGRPLKLKGPATVFPNPFCR